MKQTHNYQQFLQPKFLLILFFILLLPLMIIVVKSQTIFQQHADYGDIRCNPGACVAQSDAQTCLSSGQCKTTGASCGNQNEDLNGVCVVGTSQTPQTSLSPSPSPTPPLISCTGTNNYCQQAPCGNLETPKGDNPNDPYGYSSWCAQNSASKQNTPYCCVVGGSSQLQFTPTPTSVPAFICPNGGVCAFGGCNSGQTQTGTCTDAGGNAGVCCKANDVCPGTCSVGSCSAGTNPGTPAQNDACLGNGQANICCISAGSSSSSSNGCSSPNVCRQGGCISGSHQVTDANYCENSLYNGVCCAPGN